MKKRKKKFNILRLIIVVLFLYILYFSVDKLLDIKTKNIVIMNNNYYKDHEIIDAAGIADYPKFILLNKRKIKNKLLKLDLVEEAIISKKYNFELNIEIVEKKILYLTRSTNLYKVSTNEEYDLSGVVGVPTLINYVPEDIEEKFVRKFTDIDESIIEKISEIEYSKTSYDDERFLLYMVDGNEVYITINKIKNLNKYVDIIKELENKKGILYLDSGNYFEIKEK